MFINFSASCLTEEEQIIFYKQTGYTIFFLSLCTKQASTLRPASCEILKNYASDIFITEGQFITNTMMPKLYIARYIKNIFCSCLSRIYFLADPCKARDCSINIIVINLLTHPFPPLPLGAVHKLCQPKRGGGRGYRLDIFNI